MVFLQVEFVLFTLKNKKKQHEHYIFTKQSRQQTTITTTNNLPRLIRLLIKTAVGERGYSCRPGAIHQISWNN